MPVKLEIETEDVHEANVGLPVDVAQVDNTENNSELAQLKKFNRKQAFLRQQFEKKEAFIRQQFDEEQVFKRKQMREYEAFQRNQFERSREFKKRLAAEREKFEETGNYQVRFVTFL